MLDIHYSVSDPRQLKLATDIFTWQPEISATFGVRIPTEWDRKGIKLLEWSRFPAPLEVLLKAWRSRRKPVKWTECKYPHPIVTNIVQPVVDVFNSLFVKPGVCLGINVKPMESFKHCVHVVLEKDDSHSTRLGIGRPLCLIVVEDPGVLGKVDVKNSDENSAARAWAAAAYRLSTQMSCPYVQFTDAIFCVSFGVNEPGGTLRLPIFVNCEQSSPGGSPATSIACMLLHACHETRIERFLDDTPRRPYKDEPGPYPIGPVPPTVSGGRANFSEWSQEEMKKADFRRWARQLADNGSTRRIKPNIVMKGTRYAFPALPKHLECPVEPIEPPAETMHRVHLHMRPDSPLLRKILQKDFILSISDTIKVGPGKWSQVVQAEVQLAGSNVERPLPEVCVKLYDERFFFRDTALADDDDDDVDSDDNGLDLHQKPPPEFATAAEIARQEDVAYRRMEQFQGSFIPHYYGLYMFEYDGWQTLGIICEYIPCNRPLRSIFTLKTEVLRQFINDLRHAVRCMRYADLYQPDVAEKNVLHLQHSLDPNLWTPVLIDFGMAYASLPGYHLPTPYLKYRWTKMLKDADHDSVLDGVLSEPGVWFDEDDVEH